MTLAWAKSEYGFKVQVGSRKSLSLSQQRVEAADVVSLVT